MLELDIRKVIDKLPEVSELLVKVRERKRELKRYRIKLKGLHKKYIFLGEMLQEPKGVPLVVAVCKCLKDIGYNAKIVKGTKGADIIIQDSHRIILIEVKGFEPRGTPKSSDTEVIDRYVTLETDKGHGIPVFGVFILNHEHKESDLSKRIDIPFNAEQIKVAKLKGYGLLTTTELLNGYLLLKCNQITFEQFDEKLLQNGAIKF